MRRRQPGSASSGRSSLGRRSGDDQAVGTGNGPGEDLPDTLLPGRVAGILVDVLAGDDRDGGTDEALQQASAVGGAVDVALVDGEGRFDDQMHRLVVTATATSIFALPSGRTVDYTVELNSGADTVTLPLAHDGDGRSAGGGGVDFTRAGPDGAISQVGDGAFTLDLAYDGLARQTQRTPTVGRPRWTPTGPTKRRADRRPDRDSGGG